MKRILFIVFLALASTRAFAYDFTAVCETGQTLWYDILSMVPPYTVAVSAPSDITGDLIIPATVEHNGTVFSVVAVKDRGFSSRWDLTSVVFPEGLVSIGSEAFQQCIRLESVTLSNTVETIDVAAFSWSSLASITMSDGLVSIGASAFEQCRFASIVLPDGLTNIGNKAFSWCTNLTSLAIPASVSFIGEAIVYGNKLQSISVDAQNSVYDSRGNCNAIIETAANRLIAGCQNTVIPNTVVEIGDMAFADAFYIVSIEIPNSVQIIGKSAFAGTRLKSVSIGNSVFDIREGAFSGCYFHELVIPNSVVRIGDGAFRNCDSIVSLTIGESVRSIGASAFYFGRSLENLVIPNSVDTIYNSAFEMCDKLKTANLGKTVYIGRAAFKDCKELVELTIPETVTYIANLAFDDCTNLTTVNFNAVNCTFMGDGYSPFSGCNSFSNLIFGDQVSVVPNYAFRTCRFLTSVDFPNSLETICRNAFERCYKLSAVSFGSSLKTIGGEAFLDCGSLSAVSFPDALTEIGSKAFMNDTALISLHLGKSVSSIGSSAFYNCPKLQTITVSSENETFDSRDNCNAIIVKQNDELILGSNRTVIPPSVKRIGNGAFENRKGLEEVTLSEQLRDIGTQAFSGCTNIKKVNFNVVDCPDLFDNCWTPFHQCDSFSELIIGEMVRCIPEESFGDCKGLKTLILPKSVSLIGRNAFSGCTGVEEMYCYNPSAPYGEGYSACFRDIDRDIPIHICVGSLWEYSTCIPWDYFTNFIEDLSAGVEEWEEENKVVFSVNGTNLEIQGETVLKVEVYDLAGRCVAQGQGFDVSLQLNVHGTFVVVCEGLGSKKIVL